MYTSTWTVLLVVMVRISILNCRRRQLLTSPPKQDMRLSSHGPIYGHGGFGGAGQASGSQLGFGLETFNTSAEASCEDFRSYRQRPSPLLSWRPQKYKASSVRTASPPGSTSTPVASLTLSGTVIRRGEIQNQISRAASSTIVRLEPQVCTASSQRTAHISTYELPCTSASCSP